MRKKQLPWEWRSPSILSRWYTSIVNLHLDLFFLNSKWQQELAQNRANKNSLWFWWHWPGHFYILTILARSCPMASIEGSPTFWFSRSIEHAGTCKRHPAHEKCQTTGGGFNPVGWNYTVFWSHGQEKTKYFSWSNKFSFAWNHVSLKIRSTIKTLELVFFQEKTDGYSKRFRIFRLHRYLSCLINHKFLHVDVIIKIYQIGFCFFLGCNTSLLPP